MLWKGKSRPGGLKLITRPSKALAGLDQRVKAPQQLAVLVVALIIQRVPGETKQSPSEDPYLAQSTSLSWGWNTSSFSLSWRYRWIRIRSLLLRGSPLPPSFRHSCPNPCTTSNSHVKHDIRNRGPVWLDHLGIMPGPLSDPPRHSLLHQLGAGLREQKTDPKNLLEGRWPRDTLTISDDSTSRCADSCAGRWHFRDVQQHYITRVMRNTAKGVCSRSLP